MRKIVRLFSGWLILWISAAGLLLLVSRAWIPHSVVGWSVVFLVALPLSLLGEFLCERVISWSPLGLRLDARAADTKPSLLRIAFVLICVIVIGIALTYAFALLDSSGWRGAL
jgi:hypothetical protein